MSLGHEHGLVLIGLAGPMDVVNLSLSLSLSPREEEEEIDYVPLRPMRTDLS